MPAIWQNNGAGWNLLATTGFPDEATLHKLVAESPQLLPLAGTPRLTIVGTEVQLGSGYADLIAVEPEGRVVVIEIKLARNAEARRAVVSQALAYAAYLFGLAPENFEIDVLGRHLRNLGYDSLQGAVAAGDQEGGFEPAQFAAGLAESLRDGRFRVVFVLDDAPEELVRLVGYLESISDKVLIDLITMSSYKVEGTTILVPQRVDSERQAHVEAPIPRPRTSGYAVPGADDFIKTFADVSEPEKAKLKRLTDWAIALQAEGLAKLTTYHGVGRWTLLPRIQPDNVGLVTIYNDGRGYFTPFRTVFERKAPNALIKFEACIAPAPVGQGNSVFNFNAEALEILTEAYREAATPQVMNEKHPAGALPEPT